mgnify:CR=1 FL=1
MQFRGVGCYLASTIRWRRFSVEAIEEVLQAHRDIDVKRQRVVGASARDSRGAGCGHEVYGSAHLAVGSCDGADLVVRDEVIVRRAGDHRRALERVLALILPQQGFLDDGLALYELG